MLVAMADSARDLDVLVVGAGISGIDAAYHLQKAFPSKTFAIVEGRDRLGGTWDLFRYPGIRSDSDMFTLGFPFRPWASSRVIAGGDQILSYVRDTAEAFGIDKRIRSNHRVESARWSSDDGKWLVEVRTPRGVEQLTCRFLFSCTGYYDYENPYTPEFPGRERFRGRVIHPQHWPDLDYTNQRIVVIGSGATAMTLVPALTDRAAHVTMLQRSPTYVLSLPAVDPVASWLLERLPPRNAAVLARWKNVTLGMLFNQFCRRYPERAKKLLLTGVEKQLAGAADLAHFTPTYNPWDQRMCLVPDADLFAAIKCGKASVVTDRIATFTETGIALESGTELPADIIVTATGLRLSWMGGIELEVDGKRIEPTQMMIYRGMMATDVPNLAFAVGYTNASWTLRCDLTSRYVCRLLAHMERHGYRRVCPRRDPRVAAQPLLALQSGYIQRAAKTFPQQGVIAPWQVRQNYMLDRASLELQSLAHPSLEMV
jgi:monooxygenase